MGGEILTQRRRDAECAEAGVAGVPDVARHGAREVPHERVEESAAGGCGVACH